MNTNDLINSLAADQTPPGPPPGRMLMIAAIGALVAAAALFFAMVGPRDDIMTAMRTVRFDFKFVYTLTLAFSALAVAVRLAEPQPLKPGETLLLWLAPGLLMAAVIAELIAVPADLWMPRAIGNNSMICMRYIPMLSVVPVALVLWALRSGAPTNPWRAGAVAGLVGGGIGAAFYAAHCNDDSPLFVLVWYTIGIGVMALLGALAGSRFLRW
ncbi:MAG: DUF1109 family protein [Alphaproteobacteria bacterium]|nr:DUF1109 family protein [Alphaproteobacteria bacterium]